MSEVKFTPGPWRYNISTNGEVVSVNERGPDTTVVEADAANPWNSWLIAAAPELYEALADLFDAYDGQPGFGPAKKALAKARGEKQ